MSQMRPASFPASLSKDVHDNREQDVYNLLAKNLPIDTIALYEPTVFGKGGGRKYPDFVLLHPSFGVVTMEVKNWNLDKISDVNTNTVSRRIGDSGMKVQVTHPFKQSRQHKFALEESITRDLAKYPEVVRSDGPHAGKIAFPVRSAVLFMGTNESYMERIIEVFNKTLVPEEVITEEALSNPDLLLRRLQGIPGAFKGVALGAEILRKIADSLIPPAASDSERLRFDDDKRRKILPQAEYVLSTPGESEDNLTAYNRLREDLRGVSEDLLKLIDPDESGKRRAKDIKNILDEINSDEFKVGLFGPTAAGKSTFINALFGREFLCRAHGETTKTLTRIRRPFGNHKVNQATIIYKTLEEINEETMEYLLADAKVDVDPKTFSLADAEKRKQLRSQVEQKPSSEASYDVRAAHKFLAAVVNGWEENSSKLGLTPNSRVLVDMDLEASTELCHREEAAVFIKSRDIYIKHYFTDNRFVFIDSPGVGSSLIRHTNLAVETARDVDAAAMVLNAGLPYMEAERKFITRVKRIRDADSLEHYFFILNKISSINPKQVGAQDFSSAVAQQCDSVKKKLLDDGITTAPVVPVEAECALLAQLVTNSDGCDSETRKLWVDGQYCLEDKKADFPDPGKNLTASGFQDLVSRLKSHLSKVKIVSFLGTRFNKLVKATDAFNSDIVKEIEEIDKNMNDFIKEHEDHKKSKERAEKIIDYFLKCKFEEKVDEIVKKILIRANEIAHKEIKEIVLKIVKKNAPRYFKDDAINPTDFWRAMFEKDRLDEEVEKIISVEQEKFQNEYRELRESIKSDLISDIIVKEYGEKIKWDFDYKPLPVNANASIKSIYRLELGMWQSGKITVYRILNWFSRIIFDEDLINIDSTITEAMNENYISECAFEINVMIYAWLKNDCEKFKKDTKESFDELMQAIEEGIIDRMNAIGSKAKEREARIIDLNHYRIEIDRTMEKLKDLKTSIAKLNPR